MSAFKTKEFKRLHRAWMQKLKEEGFNDIEDLSSPKEWLKTWDSFYFQTKDDIDTFDDTIEYYRVASDLLVTHDFDSELERKIWLFHCEGTSVRDIELKLMESKTYVWELFSEDKPIKREKINKDLINAIIQRLQKFVGRR